jgi:hypothetical protein
MMQFKKKLLTKLSNRFKKEVDDVTHFYSENIVKQTIKNQTIKKYFKYQNDIAIEFPIWVEKYHTLLSYLRYDFNLKSISKDGDSTDIESELKLRSESERVINAELSKKVSKFDKWNLNKSMKKWFILSGILSNYLFVLRYLRTCADSKEYKEINFKEEEELHTTKSYLIEDFTMFMQND